LIVPSLVTIDRKIGIHAPFAPAKAISNSFASNHPFFRTMGRHDSSITFLDNVALYPSEQSIAASTYIDARSTASVLSITSEKIGAKPVSCYKRNPETNFCQV
jgi:hypothetical protein